MKKQKRPNIPGLVVESLNQMRSALVSEGYMLPTSAEDLTVTDLSLYGKGKPQSFASLARNANVRAERLKTHTPDESIYQSMAMAARNGQQISKDILARMQVDRLRVEKGLEDND